MTRLIPIVALISEDVLPALHAATDRYRADTPIDVLDRVDALAQRNGWTDDAIAAGALLGEALKATR